MSDDDQKEDNKIGFRMEKGPTQKLFSRIEI